VSFKKIRIYIVFATLLVTLKKISIVCYNMKMKNIYTLTIVRNLYTLTQ